MDTSCLFYICLISSLHCLIVTWLVVAIETPTTESNEDSSASLNSSATAPRTTEKYNPTEDVGLRQDTTFLDKTNFTAKDNVSTQTTETTKSKTKPDSGTTNAYLTTQADVTTEANTNISANVITQASISTEANVNSTDEVTSEANVTREAYTNTTANVTTHPALRTESDVKSVLDFMPACPPPNNLHQLCNITLGNVTCSERTIIFKSCYHTYTALYSNSLWDLCVFPVDRCEDIVNFLENENVIGKDAIPTTSHAYHSAITTVPSDVTFARKVTQYPPVIVTKGSKPVSSDKTSAKHSEIEETTVESAGPEMTSNPAISDSDNPVTLSPTISPSGLPPVVDESNGHDLYPSDPLSWLWPLIGCLFILLEIIILWYFCWCRQKKYNSSPVGRYRRASTGSMVIQEDIIDPESTSPTKALYVNNEYDEDQALKEDEKIFNSYLNLRFIDDMSAEGTPERALIK